MLFYTSRKWVLWKKTRAVNPIVVRSTSFSNDEELPVRARARFFRFLSLLRDICLWLFGSRLFLTIFGKSILYSGALECPWKEFEKVNIECHKKQQSIGFMDLPGECRNLIYRELMVLDSPIDIVRKWDVGFATDEGGTYTATPKKALSRLDFNLSAASKQIYHESKGVFYSCNRFSMTTDRSWKTVLAFLEFIGSESRHSVAHMTVVPPALTALSDASSAEVQAPSRTQKDPDETKERVAAVNECVRLIRDDMPSLHHLDLVENCAGHLNVSEGGCWRRTLPSCKNESQIVNNFHWLEDLKLARPDVSYSLTCLYNEESMVKHLPGYWRGASIFRKPTEKLSYRNRQLMHFKRIGLTIYAAQVEKHSINRMPFDKCFREEVAALEDVTDRVDGELGYIEGFPNL